VLAGSGGKQWFWARPSGPKQSACGDGTSESSRHDQRRLCHYARIETEPEILVWLDGDSSSIAFDRAVSWYLHRR
jgi:hypothetical protein